MAYFGGIGAASADGILIKGSSFLDSLSKCDSAVFDKTGTLTRGLFKVTEIEPDDISENELLTLAAAAEQYSTHPIATSLKQACMTKGLSYASVLSDIEEIPGRGIRAAHGEKILLVGNGRLMSDEGISIPCDPSSGTEVYVAEDGIYLGKIVISDSIRPEAVEVINSLRQLGVKKAVMLTGDREITANKIATDIGIDHLSELLPEDKVAALENIMSSSGITMFVGDGINDAPVIARADIGIAMGGLGSDAAIEAADVVLMDDSLVKLPKAVQLARRTRKIVIQNIVFALTIKALALILGALGLVGLGVAVFADVDVAVIAILNSIRNLKKVT
jgi:Cd2+/Zn2+-exporting ATPase